MDMIFEGETRMKTNDITVIRLTKDIIITAWWEPGGKLGDEPFFVVRQMRSADTNAGEKTFRFQKQEAIMLSKLILADGL
jgi:hypothetical protein